MWIYFIGTSQTTIYTTEKPHCANGTPQIYDFFENDLFHLKSINFPKNSLTSALKGSGRFYTEEGYNVQLSLSTKTLNSEYLIKNILVHFENVAYYQIEMITSQNEIIKTEKV